MAVIFELVVNFGTNKEAATAAAELVRRAGHVDVGGVQAPLGGPRVTQFARPPAYILGEKWRLGPEQSAFEPGYRWLPYSGSRIPGAPLRQ